MNNYKYYEQLDFWNRDYLKIPAEKERIEEVINAIPSDVRTILDVGCGNGSFVNTLADILPKRFDKIVGVDYSKEALKYVKVEKYKASISDLPFKNESFDLVTSLEVLEHLPQEDFKRGISELQRICKKYILITVPNEDDLEQSLVMCPKCYCWFNPCFHLRSFNKKSLQNLFEKFNPIKIKEIGPLEKSYYCRSLHTFYRIWKKPLPPKTAICPQCGYQHKESSQGIKNNNSGSTLLKLFLLFKPLAKIIWPSKKKKRWLLALYEKSSK